MKDCAVNVRLYSSGKIEKFSGRYASPSLEFGGYGLTLYKDGVTIRTDDYELSLGTESRLIAAGISFAARLDEYSLSESEEEVSVKIAYSLITSDGEENFRIMIKAKKI